MARSVEVVSVLVALEFVVLSLVLVVLTPFEVWAGLLPLLLVFLVALHVYRS